MNESERTNQKELDFTAYFFNGSPLIRIVLQAVAALGVILHIFLLIVLQRVKTKRKNYFLLVNSLSVADLLMALVQSVQPISVAYYVRDMYTGNSLYIRRSIDQFLEITVICAVAMNLMVIAVDSYIAIVFPLKYASYMTKRKCKVCVMIIWVFAALCGSSCYISAALQKILYLPDGNYFYLSYICLDNTTHYDIDYLVMLAMQVICVLVLLAVYTRVCIEICKQQDFEQNQLQIGSNQPYSTSVSFWENKKGVVTSILIIATYLVLAMPYYFYFFLVMMNIFEYNSNVIEMLGTLLLINCSCDAIIYMPLDSLRSESHCLK